MNQVDEKPKGCGGGCCGSGPRNVPLDPAPTPAPPPPIAPKECLATYDSCCSSKHSSKPSCDTICQSGKDSPNAKSVGCCGSVDCEKDREAYSLERTPSMSTPGRHQVVFSIQGMDCPSCSPRVVRALNGMPSVADCHVDVFAGSATVTYHPDRVNPDDMMRHVTASTGFQCQVVQDKLIGDSDVVLRQMRVQLPLGKEPPAVKGTTIQEIGSGLIQVEYEAHMNPRDVLAALGGTYVALPRQSGTDSAKAEVLRLLRLTIVSALACIPVLVFAWAPLPPHPTAYGAVSLGLTTVIQVVARPIYVSGVRALVFQRTIDMDLLVGLSIGTAYVFSTVAYACRVAGRPIQGESYFETAALLVTLVMFGRLIAAYARRRSTSAVSQIGAIQAETATLVAEDIQVIPSGLVHVGDVLRISSGQVVPTDGRVISGEAYVDESTMTGESVPILKRTGAVLVAGTVLVPHPITTIDMRVTVTPDANTISRMAQLMNAAQSARLPVQDITDRVAGWLAPAALFLALVAFVAWIGVGVHKSGSAGAGRAAVDAIGYAVAILVVSCPCALALCVPMVAVIAVAVGTRRGVLFKAVEALEAACGIQVVVFDKTGTLTLGKLAVDSSAYYCQTDITWASTEQGIQSTVRALTASSLHPVSAAIHEYLSVLDPQGSAESLDVRVVPGKGVEADFGGVVVRGGSAAWADGEGTTDSGNHTVFVVSVASNPTAEFTRIAYYTLSDSPRPDALATVQALTRQGIQVHVLSGDAPGVVARTAAALGIPASHARGGCSPQDKAHWIRYLQDPADQGESHTRTTHRKKVMFVGDGTNDALALVQSDLGVSLASGTDVASSAAHVVLVASLGTGLESLFSLARAARRRVRLNMVWAVVYNVAAILLASGVLGRVRIPPQWAGLGELVSVVPVVLVAWSLGVVGW